MSRTLLVIMSHAGANEMVVRLMPHYERSGCDILGIGRIGSVWPASPSLIGFRNEGQDCYNDGTSQLVRFLDVLEFVLSRADKSPYGQFAIIEWDTLLVREMPMWATEIPYGLTGTHAGGRSEGFHTDNFFHCPWLISRRTASDILQYGHRLLRAGLTESGFLDRWLGMLCQIYDIPVGAERNAYTKNSLDRPEYIEQARAAIKAGAWAVHGVKSESQLAQLTEGL